MTEGSPTVFISGAAAGISRATALAFSRRGYRVGAYDIDLAGLASLRGEITARGGGWRSGPRRHRRRGLGPATGGVHRNVAPAGHPGQQRRHPQFRPLPADPAGNPAQDRRRQRLRRDGRTARRFPTCATPQGNSGARRVVNLCSASAIYGQPELATLLGHQVRRPRSHRGAGTGVAALRHRVIAMWPLFVQTAMVDGMETHSSKRMGIHLTPGTSPGDLRRDPPDPQFPTEGALPRRPADQGGGRGVPGAAQLGGPDAQQDGDGHLTRRDDAERSDEEERRKRDQTRRCGA